MAHKHKRTPFVTYMLCLVLLSVHIVKMDSIEPEDLWKLALIPSQVARFQLWRLFTFAFFHVNFVHLLFNVVSLLQIGYYLERRIGSVIFLIHILVFVSLTGLAFSMASIMLSLIGNFSIYDAPLIGFTGVNLALSIIETKTAKQPIRSLLFIVQVPTKFYTLALFVAAQLCLPNSSVEGQLSGVLAGAIHYIIFEKSLHEHHHGSHKPKKEPNGQQADSEPAGAFSPFALFNLPFANHEDPGV